MSETKFCGHHPMRKLPCDMCVTSQEWLSPEVHVMFPMPLEPIKERKLEPELREGSGGPDSEPRQ